MANTSIDGAPAHLQKFLDADADALAGSRRKFPLDYRAEIQECVDDLLTLNQAVPLSESERLVASKTYQGDIEKGREWVRSIHARIHGLPPGTQRLPIYKAYDFERDIVGELDDDRVIALLRQAPVGSGAQTVAGAELPDDWLSRIAALLAAILSNRPKANIGGRSDTVRDRRTLLDRAEDLISRTHGFLTWALKERDFDPLMHEYGFDPRKKPGRSEEPKPVPIPVV